MNNQDKPLFGHGWALLIGLTPLTILIYLCCGMAFSCGISVADDSYISLVSKSLATGAGYASPCVSTENIRGVAPFSTDITSGPTIVLPSALAIHVFGPSDNTPSLATAILWLATLSSGLILILRHAEPKGLLNYLSAPLLITAAILGTFGFHFEQFYTVLGEIPAAVFLFVSILILAGMKGCDTNYLIAGLTAGLAINSKILIIIGIPGVYLALLFSLISRRLPYQAYLRPAFLLSTGLVLPIACFELWKCCSLGLTGYMENWQQFFNFLKQQGVNSEHAALGAKLKNALQVFHDRFQLGPIKLATYLAVLTFGLFRIRKSRIFLAAASALISGLCLLAYWLLLSKGIARYSIIGLFLVFLSLSIIPIALRRMEAALYIAAILAISLPGTTRLSYALSHADNGFFQPSSKRLERAQAVNIIEGEISKEASQLVSQWWACFVDIQYSMNTFCNIDKFDFAPPSQNTLFVANKQFLDKTDKRLAALYAPPHQKLFDGKYYLIIKW